MAEIDARPLITVVGSWGYGATIPDDAWLAMLAAAGVYLHPYIAQLESGGLEMWSEADVTERYGPNPLGSLLTNWSMTLYGPPGPGGVQGRQGVVGLYRRVAIY